jgi:hypothetical protein
VYETKTPSLIKLSDYAIFIFQMANTVSSAITLVSLTQIGYNAIDEEVNALCVT